MGSNTILIAEDQNIIALDLRGRLQAFGYSVVATLPSGEEAVKACGDLRPNLILMNYRLKGTIDGIQAAAEIRSAHDILIISLTAHSDEQTLQRARLAEPDNYLLKPVVTPEQQACMLARQCDGGQGFYFGYPMPPDAVTDLMRPSVGTVFPVPSGSIY